MRTGMLRTGLNVNDDRKIPRNKKYDSNIVFSSTEWRGRFLDISVIFPSKMTKFCHNNPIGPETLKS